MRALGLDLGSARIGVAVCDRDGVLATPYEVVTRSGDRAADHARIAALVDDTGAEVLVVGMPYSLDGSVGPAAQLALDEVEELRTRLGGLGIEVVTHDERLTTVTAQRELRSAGVRGRKQRAVVDGVAAAVMLQSWLDTPTRGRPEEP